MQSVPGNDVGDGKRAVVVAEAARKPRVRDAHHLPANRVQPVVAADRTGAKSGAVDDDPARRAERAHVVDAARHHLQRSTRAGEALL